MQRDLSSYTVAELRALAKQKGVKIPRGTRKAEIVEMLSSWRYRSPSPVRAMSPTRMAMDYQVATPAEIQRFVNSFVPSGQFRSAWQEMVSRFSQQFSTTAAKAAHALKPYYQGSRSPPRSVYGRGGSTGYATQRSRSPPRLDMMFGRMGL